MREDGLKGYWNELVYGATGPKDVPSRAKLLWHTGRYHARNFLKSKIDASDMFSINVALAPGYERPVHLRTFPGDLAVLYEVFMDRCYHVPDDVLPPDEVRTVFDCGGNVGLTALYLAGRYPKARIFTVEPMPANFEMIERNTKDEPRIVAIRGALVGSPCESVRMTADNMAWGNSVAREDAGGAATVQTIDVPAITIEQICRRYDVSSIDFMKVDIEGGEEDVFSKSVTLPSIRLGLIELHGDYSKARFDADLAKWGYGSFEPEETGLPMLSFRRTAAT